MGTSNPCCIPLKAGVKIITHLSMALAIAVGCMGIRLISISEEVKSNPLLQNHNRNHYYQQQQQQTQYMGSHNNNNQFEEDRNEILLWKSNSISKVPFMSTSRRVLGFPTTAEEDGEDSRNADRLSLFPIRRDGSSSSRMHPNETKPPSDFFQEYAKVLFICGLMAICAVSFQFFTSFLLLCFINGEGKAASQIWVAVNCSVLFCLATCLVLFVCEGFSVPAFSLDEKLFLVLLTIDTLMSIYFVWVVMAFI